MPTTNNSKPFQQGSALISALFIITLVAIAATAMSIRIQMDIYRTRLTIQSDKLYLASEAVSFWAMGELSNKKISVISKNNDGALIEFPRNSQNLSPNLVTTGVLYDIQGRFNLNNLIEKDYFPFFIKLLENVLPDVDAKEREKIAIATKQWITPYAPGRGNDEFVSYYTQQKPPYYPAQDLMQNVSEFRLIRGVDATIYRTLSPYITALPEVTKINLNSASKLMLMSLGNGVTESQVTEIIRLRGNKGIKEVGDLFKHIEDLNIRPQQLTVESKYFMSIAKVTGDDQSLLNYSIIARARDQEGNISVSLVNESLNSP